MFKHSRYRISSNKHPGAYLKFRLKGGALIGRRALNRGGRLLSFPFNELYFILAKSLIEKQNHNIIHVNVTSILMSFVCLNSGW